MIVLFTGPCPYIDVLIVFLAYVYAAMHSYIAKVKIEVIPAAYLYIRCGCTLIFHEGTSISIL